MEIYRVILSLQEIFKHLLVLQFFIIVHIALVTQIVYLILSCVIAVTVDNNSMHASMMYQCKANIRSVIDYQ